MTGRTAVLIGPMGAGKTSVGRKAAKLLGAPFTDTDSAIAAEHGPIPDIFAREGEAAFRAHERVAVAHALAAGGVISLGGGAVLDPRTRADLAGVPVVLLTVERAVVARRVRGSDRPLLAGADPMVRWDQVWAERAELYAQLADATFDTSHGPIRVVAEDVAAWIGRRWTNDDGAPAPQEG